jgi:hypothetical protein
MASAASVYEAMASGEDYPLQLTEPVAMRSTGAAINENRCFL